MYDVVLNPANMHYVKSANARMHWTQEHEVRTFWRNMARALFAHRPKAERAKVVVTFTWPDRRRRDVHNYVPYVVKPIVDGMIDAGILPDDDDNHLVGPDLRVDAEKGGFSVKVTVVPITGNEEEQ